MYHDPWQPSFHEQPTSPGQYPPATPLFRQSGPLPPSRSSQVVWFGRQIKWKKIGMGYSVVIALLLACSSIVLLKDSGETSTQNSPPIQVEETTPVVMQAPAQAPTPTEEILYLVPTHISTYRNPSPTKVPISATPSPTKVPISATPPKRGETSSKLTATPSPSATSVPGKTGVNGNPWGYNFQPGDTITEPPEEFCSYFQCVSSFWSGQGYVIECRDGKFSTSGGRPRACAKNGGVARPLYAH